MRVWPRNGLGSGERTENGEIFTSGPKMNKNVVNAIVWWGGLIGYSVWYKNAFPDKGFWASLFDWRNLVFLLVVSIVQAIAVRIFCRGGSQ
jgi:hypothetical protein